MPKNKCQTCKHLGKHPDKAIYCWAKPEDLRRCTQILAMSCDQWRVVANHPKSKLSNACKHYEPQ